MTYEVPVVAVSRTRDRRAVAAVVGAACLIVGGALAGLAASGAGPALHAPVAQREAVTTPAVARLEPAVAAAARPPAAPLTRARPIRPMPDSIHCNDVDGLLCGRIVREGLSVLPADLPRVHEVAVWRSLLCSNDFDCPPEYLRGSVPAGSVVVTFADGSPSVAVNVVDWQYGPQIRLGLRGWVVRSAPVTN